MPSISSRNPSPSPQKKIKLQLFFRVPAFSTPAKCLLLSSHKSSNKNYSFFPRRLCSPSFDRSIDGFRFAFEFYRSGQWLKTPMICKSNIIQYIIIHAGAGVCSAFPSRSKERLKLSILICLLFSRFFAFIRSFFLLL